MELYIPKSADFPFSNLRDPLLTPRVQGVDFICNPEEFMQPREKK